MYKEMMPLMKSMTQDREVRWFVKKKKEYERVETELYRKIK